jgi:hypothetical protein
VAALPVAGKILFFTTEARRHRENFKDSLPFP